MTERMKARIDAMSHKDMAWQWRFAPVGSPLFQEDTGEYFKKRFRELGGWSPALSKKIGRDCL